jgi:hypothetical protein
MNLSKLSIVTSALLVLLGTSCASTPKTSWVKGEAASASQHVLYEVTKMALVKSNFPVLGAGFDPVTRTMSSGWRTDLVPLTGRRTRGFRERAWVKYSASEVGEITFEVRVERQINKNLARPLDPQYADWEPGPDSTERARFLLQLIKVILHPTVE